MTPARVFQWAARPWWGYPLFSFFFPLIFYKLQQAGQRAPRTTTFLLWNAFNSLPVSTLCISGWQGCFISRDSFVPTYWCQMEEVWIPPLVPLAPTSHEEERRKKSVSSAEGAEWNNAFFFSSDQRSFSLSYVTWYRTEPVQLPNFRKQDLYADYCPGVACWVHFYVLPIFFSCPSLALSNYSSFLSECSCCVTQVQSPITVLVCLSKQDASLCFCPT